ncbi:MAG: PAS domain S-box protein [Cyanothece sp. SIO1E1]|nr:PAS domain S-box protein [Cyanothece sp. SIO1E1]
MKEMLKEYRDSFMRTQFALFNVRANTRLLSELLFNHFGDKENDLIILVNKQGEIELMNKKWLTIFGYNYSDVHGKLFIDFVHPDDHRATMEMFEHVKEHGMEKEFYNRYRCKNGNYRWISWKADIPSSNELIIALAKQKTPPDVDEVLKSRKR